MELISSGLMGRTHYAPVQSNDAGTQRVTRLDLSACQKVCNVSLAGSSDRARDLRLAPAGAGEIGQNLLEAHVLYDTAYAIDRKGVAAMRYSPGGLVNDQTDEQMSVGDRLKAARKERKLTQTRLAEIAGLSQTTISDIERGRNTSSKELPMLAAALGVSSFWLATGRGARADSAPIRPTAPHRQINTDLLIQAMRATTAYKQQVGGQLDDDEVLQLACRVYEQFFDTPDKPASEMLGYLVTLAKIIGRARDH